MKAVDLHSLILLACISGLLAQPVRASDVRTSAQNASPQKLPTHLSVKQLQQIGRSITVRVSTGDTWGSGIITRRQGEVYTVLTNQHVLTAGELPQIQTLDGRLYPASPLPSARSEDDLELVQFRSLKIVYPVALLKPSSKLAVGDEVFAAGFPLEANSSKSKTFLLTRGQIAILPNQPFIGGYQIGYTNDVKRGMSGGPLLNGQGEVVGINGRRMYPLLGDPYVFKDGSTVSDAMWEQMSHLSWAVPIQAFLRLEMKK